jgi:hypothetical protein
VRRKEVDNMNNLDVSGLLMTYSMKCKDARDSEHLKELVRDLKKELNSEEIKKLRVD